MFKPREIEMKNSIHAAFFMPPFQGGMNFLGRLLTHMDIGLKTPFFSRPRKGGKKGGLDPHGYWLHAALLNATSYRRTALQGGYCLDVKIKRKCDYKKQV